jgi:hypothetical protein
VGRGYTDEQEEDYDVCWNFRPSDVGKSIQKAEEILEADVKDTAAFKSNVERLLSERIDVTEFIVDKLMQPCPSRGQPKGNTYPNG